MRENTRILCVDDDGLLSVASRQIALKKAHLNVLLAYGAVRGLEALADERITLVILCGSFASDSAQLTAEMKRRRPGVQVIRQPRYGAPLPAAVPAPDILLVEA
jgi:DNA-binding NtrC family response regulator